jgi:SAM-dependent methyltransferase
MEDAELQRLATNLQAFEPGLWVSRTSNAPVSFPDGAHERLFELEEQSFWFRHRNRCLVEVMKRFPPGGAVFDVGGGNGYVAMGLKQGGFDAVLVEPGIEGARSGVKRGLQPVVCATVENAGFSAGSLPAIGLFDVLEHIQDDHAFLDTLHALLRPAGRLYLTVPAFQWLWSFEDVFAGHFRRYRIPTLRTLLAEHGFAVEFASYFFVPLPLPIFLFRCVPGWLGKKTSPEMHERHHGNPDRLRWALERERRALAGGRSLPMGSSCLVVARRS